MAYDGAGNSGTSGTVSVSVDNAVSDTTPPTVTIISPTDGAKVSKRVSIKLNASDDVQVQSVEVYVDGRLIGSASCAASSCSPTIKWDTKKIKVSKGYHTLTAIAFDAAGNQGTSSPVTVKK